MLKKRSIKAKHEVGLSFERLNYRVIDVIGPIERLAD